MVFNMNNSMTKRENKQRWLEVMKRSCLLVCLRVCVSFKTTRETLTVLSIENIFSDTSTKTYSTDKVLTTYTYKNFAINALSQVSTKG